MTVKNNPLFCYDKVEFFPQGPVDYMLVTRPDKNTERLSPFVHQPVVFSYDEEGIEHMELAADSKVCFRYYPQASGNYSFSVYYNGMAGETIALTVQPSAHHGYVTVSKRDARYFSYTDGSGFFPIGINLAYPIAYGKHSGIEFGLINSFGFLGLRQYERWFQKCAVHGVNVARIWLGHEYFCPDTEICGEFRYEQFSKLDRLLELAKTYGIKLKLTLEQFRFFDYDRKADTDSYHDDIFRKFNKKLYLDGVRCEGPQSWMAQRQWQDQWLLKVREFAKRYSGDSSIFAIELWNEMNSIEGMAEVIAWNRIMLTAVKELFPHNMVINSLGSYDADHADEWYRSFCWDLCDFKQMHRYLDQGAADEACRNDPADMIVDGIRRLNGNVQPFFVAETGAVNPCHSGPFKYYVNDDRGILFVDMVYTPLFTGAAGCGNIWHWDDRYVESKNLYQFQ